MSDLFPTKTRKALLRAVAEGNGRIYFEAGDVFDKDTYLRVTERMREMVSAGWVRALAPDEPRGRGETSAPGVTFYRLTAEGKKLIEEKKA